MTSPENLPREKGSDDESTLCPVCGEQMQAGEPEPDGSVVLTGHDHPEMNEQASTTPQREQGTNVAAQPAETAAAKAAPATGTATVKGGTP